MRIILGAGGVSDVDLSSQAASGKSVSANVASIGQFDTMASQFGSIVLVLEFYDDTRGFSSVSQASKLRGKRSR